MIKTVASLAAFALIAVIAPFAFIKASVFAAGMAVLVGAVILTATFARRSFLLSSVVILLGIAPFALIQGHAWIAGISAYIGLTMVFLAWNHAVHSLNRETDERRNVWTPASE